MKRIAGLLAALLCLLVFNGSLAHAEEGELLTVYVAKKIITMEPSWPEGRAIAVRDGRIVSIGRSLKDLAPWLDRYPHRIDTTFRNKILMPGFVEPHLHPLLGALILPSVFATPDDWTLPRGPSPGVRSKQAFLERVSQNHELLEDPAEWLFVFGYNLASHGEVTRADLNAISPARPIAILSRSTHVTILNDEAIEIAEITAELVQASGHGHDIDFAKGWFAEKGNMLFALPRLRPYLLSPERMTKGLEILKGLLHANGVTTLHEPGSGILSGGHPEVELEMISGVLDRDDTPFRTWLTPEASMIAARLGGAEQALAYIEGLAGKGRGRIKFTHKKMKMLVDGSYVDQLAEYDFPGYIDGHQGLPITSYADLERVGRVFWNAGYDLHVHTQGDAAARKTVDLLASLQAQKRRLEG
ncbi:MAG: amidohydrolase family protein, partial [Myxococcota bacterium]